MKTTYFKILDSNLCYDNIFYHVGLNDDSGISFNKCIHLESNKKGFTFYDAVTVFKSMRRKHSVLVTINTIDEDYTMAKLLDGNAYQSHRIIIKDVYNLNKIKDIEELLDLYPLLDNISFWDNIFRYTNVTEELILKYGVRYNKELLLYNINKNWNIEHKNEEELIRKRNKLKNLIDKEI